MLSKRSASRGIQRRDVLKGSVGTAAVLAVAGHALAQPATRAQSHGVLGANDRVRLGIIGCGALGVAHHIPTILRLSQDPAINVELAAVCDIYEPRKLRAKKMSGAELFHDYRKMLEQPGIHGVIVVTPDHWHAKMTLDAMEAGKDVHVEKPMTLHWEQAKQVYEAAERLKRVVQVGAEGTSRDNYWQARRLIEQGTIGKVVWVTGGVYRNDPKGDWNYPIEPECTPKTLDWDAFLGPAPKRPFDPERYFRYRKYWDYSGGVVHDLIAHILSHVQTCIGPEFPARVSAAGGIYVHHDRETPDTFSMQVEYPSQYMATLFCTQTTERGVEMAIRGEKGTITFDSPDDEPHQLILTPEPPYKDKLKPLTMDAEPRADHDTNFIQCMRTRAKPHCDALTGYKVMVALDLANRSWREGKMFTFDAVKQQVV